MVIIFSCAHAWAFISRLILSVSCSIPVVQNLTFLLKNNVSPKIMWLVKNDVVGKKICFGTKLCLFFICVGL